MISRQPVFSLLISVGLSAVLVWILLRQIENSQITVLLQGISIPLAVGAFALYLLIYFSRALRFNSLLSHRIPLSKMFTIMSLHNIVNVVLPARSGELSYPYLLKKEGVPYAESLSTLLAARLFDLVAIFLLFIAAIPFVPGLPAFTRNIEYTFLGMLVLGIVALATMVLWKMQLKAWIDVLRKWTKTDSMGWLTRVQHLGGNVLDTVKKYANRQLLGRLFVHSMVQWFLMFYFSYIVLRALGMEVTMAQSFIGSSLSMLVLVIPFQGVLGFGTTEAVWVVMFMTLGFAKEQLIPMAFASHIAVLAFTAVMGLYGVVRWLRVKSN